MEGVPLGGQHSRNLAADMEGHRKELVEVAHRDPVVAHMVLVEEAHRGGVAGCTVPGEDLHKVGYRKLSWGPDLDRKTWEVSFHSHRTRDQLMIA